MRRIFFLCFILGTITSLGEILYISEDAPYSISMSPQYPPGGAAYDTWQTSPTSVYIPYGINGGYFPFPPYRPTAASVHQRVVELQKFYHKLLLSKKFDSGSMAKKYRKLFPEEMMKEILRLPSDSVGNTTYKGWGIFLGKGVKAGSFCDVQYVGKNWYKAGFPDDDSSNVYLKVELMGKDLSPVVTTIYNPLYNIIIGHQSEEGEEK